MGELLRSAIAALPTVATHPLAFVAYIVVVLAWLIVALKVKRNNNLLKVLDKLPSEDRLRALQSEMGSVQLAAGLSPEQYLRSRIHLYYFLGFSILCLVGLLIFVVSAVMGQNPPGEPRTVVTASTGPSIFRQFDFKEKRLHLKIGGIIINNQSEIDDMIRQVVVVLAVPGLRQEDITDSYGKDLELIDQDGKDWGSTFVLKKSEKVILECRVSFDYSERSAAVFKQEGMRRLGIAFQGNTNPTPEIDYCYREDLPEIGNSQKIIRMDCGKNFEPGG
jgi:hypothetical protein